MSIDQWIPALSTAGGAAIALVASLTTSRVNVKHQAEAATLQREFSALESRRAEALVRADQLLSDLTVLLESRRNLFQSSWAEAAAIEVAHLEAGIRVIPDASTRTALSNLRYSLTLGLNDMSFLPEKYDSPWQVERDAIGDAIETVASYIRGDDLPTPLMERQSQRNAACKQAQADYWADVEDLER